MGRDAELLAEIAERPFDEHVRRVYADYLQERGDPRGELMALQIAHAGADRIAELVKAHGREWVGPLADWIVLAEAKFDVGFLSEVRLASARDLKPIIGVANWATVRTIHLGRIQTLKGDLRNYLRAVGRLIAHPIMRSLKEVTVTTGGQVESLMIEPGEEGGWAFVPRF